MGRTLLNSDSAKASCLYGDPHGLTSTQDPPGEAISSRAATSGRENQARRPPLRMPGPRGTRTAPAFQHAHGDCSPGSQSPLKHLLWRLETEFENSPISGGRCAGPGQSRGGVARADRPSESWRSGPRVSPAPAQLLPPRPLPLPGTWKPRAWQLIPAAAASLGGRGKPRWGRAGRREEEGGLFCYA